MKKYLKAYVLMVVVTMTLIAGVVYAEVKTPGGLSLGGVSSRNLRITNSASATTSPNFFKWSVNVAADTASTTLLTLGCTTAGDMVSGITTIEDVDQIGLFLQATASTTANTNITINTQVSNDCEDWYQVNSLYDQVTTGGTGVGSIGLNATSSILNWALGSATTIPYKNQFTIKNLASKAIRFVVDTSATSSVWIQTTEIVRNTTR